MANFEFCKNYLDEEVLKTEYIDTLSKKFITVDVLIEDLEKIYQGNNIGELEYTAFSESIVKQLITENNLSAENQYTYQPLQKISDSFREYRVVKHISAPVSNIVKSMDIVC